MLNHPLAHTLARVRQLNVSLKFEFGQPAGDGWIAVPTDLAPGASHLDALITIMQRRLRTKAAAVIGSSVLQNYQWSLISTAVACYLSDRRVPNISPANTRMHYTAELGTDALALLRPQFIALPDDPAAAHPHAHVVPDHAALRLNLRMQIEDHLGVVIEQLCAHLGCKPRGLWLNAADSFASTLIWLMQEQHPMSTYEQIDAECAALIRVSGSPLNNRWTGLIQLSYQAHSQVFLNRATCCYWYKTEGGECCSTCPRRPLEERHERLRAYLFAKHQPPITGSAFLLSRTQG